jgi:hypothetical protein
VEVDVFEDGHMEVARFLGNEDIIEGEELVSQIIALNAEPAAQLLVQADARTARRTTQASGARGHITATRGHH